MNRSNNIWTIMGVAFCIFLFIAVSACRSGKPVAATEEPIDRIMFMTFHIRRDTVQQTSVVTLVGKKEVVGTIKKQMEEQSLPSNYIMAELFRDTQLVQTIIQEHPLYRKFEYINDSNQFAVKEVKLSSADFFFRFQVRASGLKLRISEVLEKQEKTQLNTFKL